MYKSGKMIDNRKVEYLMLKQKDLRRATLIEACIKGQCTVKQVAIALGISERRVKQIKKEVKENGVKSIQHGNRGRKPKNTIPDETRKRILELRSWLKMFLNRLLKCSGQCVNVREKGYIPIWQRELNI